MVGSRNLQIFVGRVGSNSVNDHFFLLFCIACHIS